MKIGGSPPPVPVAGRPPAPTGARHGAGAFVDILHGGRNIGRDAPSMVASFLVDTGAGRFEVETHVGDAAVRFDARPIVAPVTPDPRPDAPGAVAAATDAAPPASEPPKAGLAELMHAIVQTLPAFDTREAPPVSTAPSEAPPAAPGTRSGPAARAGAVPEGRVAPRLIVAVTDGVEAAPPAARQAPPPATNALSARVAALPREILIVLRGISLAADESRALVDEIRQALVHYRFRDRPIRILGAGGMR